jgi:hypothetical protein
MNPHTLSSVHPAQTRFLEVCRHPKIIGLYDHHQLLTLGNFGSNLGVSFCDNASTVDFSKEYFRPNLSTS